MHDQDNKSFWDRFAKMYGPFMRRSKALYETAQAYIAPRITREMNVLELACGSGQLSFPLAPRAKLWEATDFSEAMIAEAKKQPGSSRLRFSVQDATDLPYADQTFDAVVIANALHIMPHPEKALAEIRRVLKPEGLLFAPTFIWRESPLAHVYLWVMNLIGFKLFNLWEADEFCSYIEQNGFQVLQADTQPGKILGLCCLEAQPDRERAKRHG